MYNYSGLLVRLALFVGMGAKVAFAAPLIFQHGRVAIVEGKLRITDLDRDALGLDSLTIENSSVSYEKQDPESGEMEKVTPSGSMPAGTRIEFRLTISTSPTRLGTFSTPQKEGTPIPGVVVAFISHAKHNFLILSSTGRHLCFRNDFHGTQLYAELEESTNGWAIKRQTFLNDIHTINNGVQFEVDEIGAANGYLFFYDSLAVRMMGGPLLLPSGGMVTNQLFYDQYLPWQIAPETPLSSQARFDLDAEVGLSIWPFDEEGKRGANPPIRMALGGNRDVWEKKSSPQQRKAAGRILWAQGIDDSLRLVNQQGQRAEGAVDLSSPLLKWVEEGLRRSGQRHGGVRPLVINIPQLIAEGSPELGQEALIQLLKMLEVATRGSEGTGVSLLSVAHRSVDLSVLVDATLRELIAHKDLSQGKSDSHFVVVDMRKLGTSTEENELVIKYIEDVRMAHARAWSSFSLNLILVARPLNFTRYFSSDALAHIESFSVESALSNSVKETLALKALRSKGGISLSASQLGSLQDKIRALGDADPLSNLDTFVVTLKSILDTESLDLTNPADLSKIASRYRQLTGERSFPTFSRQSLLEVLDLQSRISATSPQNIGRAGEGLLYDRDALLQSLQEDLVTVLKSAGKEGAAQHAVLVFIGKKGSGKTVLATRLPQIIGDTVFESVNVGELLSQCEEGRNPDSFILEEIQSAANRLTMKSGSKKILFIDEINARIGLLRAFIASEDPNDNRPFKVLNLDGLIVIVGMNGDSTDSTYEQLMSSQYGTAKARALTSTHFVRSLVKGGFTQETAEAISSRLPLKYFFKRFSQTDEARKQSVRMAVAAFSEAHHCHFILTEEALNVLSKSIEELDDYRSVKKEINRQLAKSAALFETIHDRTSLEGLVLVIKESEDRAVTSASCELEDIQESGEHVLFQENYRLFSDKIKVALSREIGVLQEKSKKATKRGRAEFKEKAALFQLLLDSFSEAARSPLLASSGDIRGFSVRNGFLYGNGNTNGHAGKNGTQRENHRIIPPNASPLPPLPKMAAFPLGSEVNSGMLLAQAPAALVSWIYNNARLDGGSEAISQEFSALPIQWGSEREIFEAIHFVLSFMEALAIEHPDDLSRASYVPAWLEEANGHFQSLQNVDTSEERRQFEIGFMKECLEAWKRHNKSIVHEALEANRQQAAVQFGATWEAKLAEVDSSRSDASLLRKFLETLVAAGGQVEAEEILKAHEEEVSVHVPKSRELSPQQKVSVATGLLLDSLGRKAVVADIEKKDAKAVAHENGHCSIETWLALSRSHSSFIRQGLRPGRR